MKSKISNVITILVLLFAALIMVTEFSGIGKPKKTTETEETLIVTSFYPMYTLGLNLTEGIDGIRVENLSTPQSGCLHDYEPTTEDMRLLTDADIFLVNGGGMEVFIGDVAKKLPDLKIVDCGSDLRDTIDDNSHFWMDIALYKDQITAAAEELAVLLPGEKADAVRTNADKYEGRLDDLLALADEVSSKASEAGVSVVNLQEAFFYTTSELGLDVIGDIDLDEERTPSAAEVSEVVDAIRGASGSVIVLTDEVFGKKTADTLAAEGNVKAVYLDTMVFPQEGEDAAEVYVTRMKANLEAIMGALD